MAGDVGDPADTAALHRALGASMQSWPTSTKEDEIHTAGLYQAVREVAEVPGDIVECGVGHGRSLVSLARANELFSPHKRVLGFDSFHGFPDAVTQDLGERVDSVGRPPSGWADTSLEAVRSVLDAPAELIPGFFEATLEATHLPDAISLLHVDCDLYASTRTVLERCLPLVSPDGLVILDEYLEPRWPGATVAVDEQVGADAVQWEPALARHVVRR